MNPLFTLAVNSTGIFELCGVKQGRSSDSRTDSRVITGRRVMMQAEADEYREKKKKRDVTQKEGL